MPVKFNPWHVVNENEDFWGITLTEGKYEGTGITINDIQMPDDSKGLMVDYTVMKNAEGFGDDDYKTKEFEAVLADILIQMITTATENLKDENRNTDSPEPNI
jgi:hypothetical protein